MNFLNSLAPYAHWLVRLSLAGTFIYHGVSKFPPTAFIEFSGLPLIVGWAVAIGEVSAGACLIVGAVTILGFAVTGFLFTRYRGRIAYWV